MNSSLAACCLRILPADDAAAAAAQRRWNSIAKPVGSLGLLETAITRICAAQRSAVPRLDKRALAVFCADNGIVAEGAAQTDCSVTAAVAFNICCGNANVSVMASCARCDVFAVDAGMARHVEHPALIRRAAARGTANFARGPAMTAEQLDKALDAGADTAGDFADAGYTICACGEMGIGNTSAASAVCSVLLGIEPECTVGPGAGLDAAGLARKLTAVKRGIARNAPDMHNVYDVLAKVGSFDMAAMAGFMIGCAACGIPVIIDGFISAVSALCAVRLCPAVQPYLLASHVSDEPAGALVLEALGLEAPIAAHMRLGEGTGAAALLPLLDMAAAVYTQAASFAASGIAPYTTFGAAKP